MSKIKIGHDSEAFATKEGVGMFPMVGNVGGTKEHPLIVPGGNLQEDNVSIEMAVDATSDLDEFVHRTKEVYKELERKVSVLGCKVILLPTVEFHQGVLDNFSPESKEEGCDPDYNTYTQEMNIYPSVAETTYRHGSGHLHIDCKEAKEDPNILTNLVMLCDMLIKAPQWLIEGNVLRNEVQGNLGNYRPKKYGVEYRSSSNIILTDDKILEHAFNSAQKASELATKGLRVSVSHTRDLKRAFKEKDKDTVVHYIGRYGGVCI